MKIFAWCAFFALALSACEGWPFQPAPYTPATIVPSRTPSIWTATPRILTPAPITATAETSTPITESPTATLAEGTPSETITPVVVPAGSISANILGCDTSIDILHGMGDVTNAYVTISNTTRQDVPNLCATLNALDEGRLHPDKTKCLPSLSAGYQVTFKLTVDSTYKANTPVQVNVMSGDTLLVRAGEAACTAIGLLPVPIDDLGTPQPIP